MLPCDGRVQPRLCPRVARAEDACRVAYISRISEHKGIRVLIEPFRKLVGTHPHANRVIAGRIWLRMASIVQFVVRRQQLGWPNHWTSLLALPNSHVAKSRQRSTRSTGWASGRFHSAGYRLTWVCERTAGSMAAVLEKIPMRADEAGKAGLRRIGSDGAAK